MNLWEKLVQWNRRQMIHEVVYINDKETWTHWCRCLLKW